MGPLKPSEASGGRQRGEGAPRDAHRVRPGGAPGSGVSSPWGCGVSGWGGGGGSAPASGAAGRGAPFGATPCGRGGRRGSLRGAGGGAAFVSPLRPRGRACRGGAALGCPGGGVRRLGLSSPGPALPSEQWSWTGGCPRERAPRRGPFPGCAFSRPLLRGLERPGVVPPREGSVLSVTCEAAAGAASQSGFWAAGGLSAGPWGGGMSLWGVGGYRF